MDASSKLHKKVIMLDHNNEPIFDRFCQQYLCLGQADLSERSCIPFLAAWKTQFPIFTCAMYPYRSLGDKRKSGYLRNLCGGET